MAGPLTGSFHEEQTFARWWLGILIAIAGIPLAFLAVEALQRPVPVLGSLVALGIVAPIAGMILMARLVVDVTSSAIVIRFHLLSPTRRIPLSEVRRAHAERYDPLFDYGGWGVRYAFGRGWAFNAGGDEGVLVETKDGRRVLIGSHHAEELEAAIARAIAGRSGP